MKKLIYTNSKGDSITFDRHNYLFTALTGFGEVGAEIQTQKAPYQDGSTFIDAVLNERAISFEVSILGKNESDIAQKRTRLGQVFNPKHGMGTLIYTVGTIERVIDVAVEHVPTFMPGKDVRGRRFQRSIIDLLAVNPYWRSTSITEEPAFEPRFRFPTRGPFIMGIQRDQRVINNDGDAPAPLKIEFFGPALNPKIINNTTGEYIRIKQELLEGERMMIDTSDDKKSVYFVDALGIERNVFNWIDLDSTFFKLVIGRNNIEYTADSDIQGTVVNISYSKLYNAV